MSSSNRTQSKTMWNPATKRAANRQREGLALERRTYSCIPLAGAAALALGVMLAPEVSHAQTAPVVPGLATPAPGARSSLLPQRPGFPGTATPAPAATPSNPFAGFSGASSMQGGMNGAPSREVPLIEKKFEELSNQKISPDGKKALEIAPEKWKHAETDNFILHYRRATEAQKVAREVEYNLWYVATTLGATKDRYSKRSHVYIFEDEDEWKKFLQVSDNPMKWAASYAWGDELYLNVRGGGNSGPGTSFDSHTLAHETTHAVVARLYPRERWPLWLNEGFAEYMGGASVAARKGQFAKRYERQLQAAELPIESLVQMTEYPSDPAMIRKLYETSEKFVRLLMTEGGKERFTKFIDAVIGGRSVQDSVVAIYPDKFKDWQTFTKRYEKFTK